MSTGQLILRRKRQFVNVRAPEVVFESCWRIGHRLRTSGLQYSRSKQDTGYPLILHFSMMCRFSGVPSTDSTHFRDFSVCSAFLT